MIVNRESSRPKEEISQGTLIQRILAPLEMTIHLRIYDHQYLIHQEILVNFSGISPSAVYDPILSTTAPPCIEVQLSPYFLSSYTLLFCTQISLTISRLKAHRLQPWECQPVFMIPPFDPQCHRLNGLSLNLAELTHHIAIEILAGQHA